MFIFYCALIGLAASGLIILISNKVNNKRLACALCCLLGIAVAVGILSLLIHSGTAANIGVIA